MTRIAFRIANSMVLLCFLIGAAGAGLSFPDLAAAGSAMPWSTYVGGTGSDYGVAVTTDANGYVYVVGTTTSPDYPVTSGACQRVEGGDRDVVVTKLKGDGSGVVWSTFLGGSGAENGLAVAVDGNGEVYVGGNTASTNFPTTAGAYRTTYGGGSSDGFVVKLSADGATLRYATYLGGSGSDLVLGLKLDGSGNVVVGGMSGSTDFPTTAGAVRQGRAGGFFDTADGFVTKLNANGSGLMYSTYLGSDAGTDEVLGLALDSQGQATVVGMTQSTDYPTTTGAYSRTHRGYWDGFVTRLNATGTGYVYSTFLPGSGYDEPQAVAVDGSGAAYVTGRTTSTDYPVTTGAAQRTYAGGSYDGFVTKLNASGSGLAYSTYLGGSGTEQSSAIVVTTDGEACVTGTTDASNFPATSGAYDVGANGGQDAFLVRVAADGTAWRYATYLGGSGDDLGRGLTLMPDGTLAATGYTLSTGFPVTSQAYDRTPNGSYDVYALKVSVGIAARTAGAELPASSAIASAAVWPNPFRSSTAVSLTLARPASVRVSVLDVEGRLVRTLAHGESAMGSVRWDWDGTDERGRDSGPGVFYMLVDAGDTRVMRAVARLR